MCENFNEISSFYRKNLQIKHTLSDYLSDYLTFPRINIFPIKNDPPQKKNGKNRFFAKKFKFYTATTDLTSLHLRQKTMCAKTLMK